jgi:cephalosporin hydroxylase
MNPTVDDFHRLYYNSFQQTWEQTYWLGTKILKCPLDLWVYQELIHQIRPDLLIETGTAFGGSAHYFACLFDLLGSGRVVTIDVAGTPFFPDRPVHPRIEYIHGSSTDPGIVDRLRSQAAGTVMVILDSDHRQAHVAQELELYAPLVTADSYLIVEDSNVNGHPIAIEHGPGPGEAIEEFLTRHPEYEIDLGCEKFFMTFNPGGFLRKHT